MFGAGNNQGTTSPWGGGGGEGRGTPNPFTSNTTSSNAQQSSSAFPQASTPLFGGIGGQSTSAPMFGAPRTTGTAFPTTNSSFAGLASTAPFSTGSTNAFGNASTQPFSNRPTGNASGSSGFGGAGTTVGTGSIVSGFGGPRPNTPESRSSGSQAFGTAGVFGSNAQNSSLTSNTNAFGGPTANSAVFGGTGSSSAANTGGFGGTGSSSAGNTGGFGGTGSLSAANTGGFGGTGSLSVGNTGGFGGTGSSSAVNTGGFGGTGSSSVGNTGGFGGTGSSSAGNTGGFGGTGSLSAANTGGFGGTGSSSVANTGGFGGTGSPSVANTGGFGGTGSSSVANTGGFGGTGSSSVGNTGGFGGTGSSSAANTGGFGGTGSLSAANTGGFGGTGSTSVGNTGGFGGIKPRSAGLGAFGTSDSHLPSPGSVFGRSKRGPLLAVPGSSLSSDTTTVFSSGRAVTAPSVFGQAAPAKTTPTSSAFGAATVFSGAQPPAQTPATNTLFGQPVTSSQSTAQSSLFGKNMGSTAKSVSTAPGSAVFGGAPSSSSPTLPTSVSSHAPSKKNPFQIHSSTSAATTVAATASSLFGKIVTTTPESTQSVFTGPFQGNPTRSASRGETKGNLFGKKNSNSGPNKGETEKESSVTEEETPEKPFGKRVEKPKTQTGLFGKGNKSAEDPDTTGEGGRRRLIQRRVPKSEAEPRRSGGLFGRALAGATGKSESSLPRVRRKGFEGTGKDDNKSREGKSSPPGLGRQTSRRRSSLDDVSQHTVLAARNIPASVNNKVALKKHFSQYGTVTKVFSTPGKSQAVIHFADHESALNAKKSGRVVRPGVSPINLFWRSLASTKVATFSPEETTSPTESEEAHGKRRSVSPKRLFAPSSEVDDELASMAGGDDAFGVTMRRVERPTGLKSDHLAGAISSTAKVAPIKGFGARGESGVERTREIGKEQTRSVSPVNLPIRRTREPVIDSKPSKSKARGDSPVPSAATTLVSLKSLIGKRCATAEDRVEVLEARDRALREARDAMNAGKDLATAGAIRGTCMDMCSEKERYLRQTRRRLTIYEIHPESDGRGLVDHSRAVKEYSRSSADQDMPLSNELRPPEVLARTMTFILNNIIQLGGEGKWSDWFEYIWSRTRGIRKDITQQQLCDLTSVMLVEQCARFHIYCAERLCEEDPAVFDEKINNENLTKCLQTLKELYADLWTKHDQACTNEAEFRAYMVLMNLNEGDILRETQQLREEIRRAPEVKFALNVHSALNSDNYIRFFKLVKQANFLNACILHRYFNQMRSRALLTFIMAYAIPGNTAQMPVDDLLRLLAFEDGEEAIRFCEHYGLLSEDGMVAIARQSFYNPETAYHVSRAKLLIESRMTVSAGEVIYGGPLPPNEILPPTDSFDHEGRFQPDAATLQLAQEQEEKGTRGAPVGSATIKPLLPSESIAEPSQPVQPPQPKHPYSNDAVKEVAKEIFLEVIRDVCSEMSHNLYQSCKAFLNMASPLTEDFLNEQGPLLVKEIAQEVVQDERNKLEKEVRARAERSAIREKAVLQIESELTDEVLSDELESIARDEKREVDYKLKQESVERCTSAIIEELVASYAINETNEFAHDYFTNEVEHKRYLLAQSFAATQRVRLRRFFTHWKNELAGRQRLQRSMLGFPAAPSMYSPQERLARILPRNAGLNEEKNAVHLGQNAWLTLTPPNELVENESELINKILRQNEEQKRKEMVSRTPLNLCQVIEKALVEIYQREMTGVKKNGIRVDLYWKMALCLPQVTCEDQYHYNEWLTNKLSTSCDHIPPEWHHRLARVIGCSSVKSQALPHHSLRLNISVRQVDGMLLPGDVALVKHERHLQATQAVLFVLGDHQSQNAKYWDRERGRLERILELVDCRQVSVLVAGPAQLIRMSKTNLLPHYHNKIKYIQAVPFTKDVVDLSATQQVQSAVEVLVSQATTQLPIKSDWITDYLQHGLHRFFYSKVTNSAYSNDEGTTNLDQVPGLLVELYNSTIHHLAEVAGDKDLKNVTWPPPEFSHSNSDLPEATWNKSDTLEYVHELVMSLTLPNFDVNCLDEDVSWNTACSNVWLYVETVAGQTHGTDVFLISRVRQVLRKAHEVFQDMCYWRTGVQEAEPSGSNIPWSKVINICVDHKLSCLDKLPPDSDLEQLDYSEIRVHYDHTLLDNFMAPEDWLNTTRQAPEPSILERSVRRAAKRKQESEDSASEKVNKSSRQSSPVKNSFSLELSTSDKQLLQVEDMTHNLLSMISQEKSANDEYEKYLEEILRDGEMPLTPILDMTSVLL